jgi:3-deoxy-manno-octulosonate cytidylyltransferase (CMP-KDO synthetase)
MRVLGVIPARYHSTRLPGKPLADIGGKPMIQHVYENCLSSALLDELLVATDDERVMEAVGKFGGTARMTSPGHRTGTDRVAELARAADAGIVVNIQGDEPFIRPGMIDEIVRPLLQGEIIHICTLKHEITDPDDYDNPNVVKVVTDDRDFALYFSRSLIPFPRHSEGHRAYEHIGIYGYPKEFLLKFTAMRPTVLETTESLEQLRALETGHRIKVLLTRQDYVPLSVDTPEDLQRARAFEKKLRAGEDNL